MPHNHARTPPANAPPKGFTLVEILIVVIILGILASVVFAGFKDAVSESRQAAFATELHHYVTAADYYAADTGQLMADSGSGQVPDGFERYINTGDWESATPLGGVWDTEGSDSGFTAGLGVHFNNNDSPGDTVMSQVDGIIDDGDLTTGLFRQAADVNRFYYVLVY
ncbi:MAG: prepilin-type N-terminal cleavage/methylation domain-containing protein [Phycisphaerales bacterium]|jgi:prepilin-type N-terminal cleavage/methylation domain-containing protein